MGVMMAPVEGSGSWPAWMQSVAKPMTVSPRLKRRGGVTPPRRSDRPTSAREEAPAVLAVQGAAEEVALHAVAVAGGQEAELLLGLHAFGHHLQLQRVREGDDGGGDGRVVGVGGDVADE